MTPPVVYVDLPDSITGPDGQPLARLGLCRPVGKHWRELERRGNLHDDGKRFSLVLDLVAVLSTEPALPPPLIEGGFTLADIQAVDEAIAPFFTSGGKGTGGAE